ncbi:MAG: HNH endonuclease [Acidobacteriota bacterium]|nr:HNH endonuclease [Acidobacteriota bacterium]
MRPIRRGDSPQLNDFADYKDAKPFLVSRLGLYCSYCERRIVTLLAVEHVQPKDGPHGHPHLIGRWWNFLLACPNCNSTKKDKKIVLAEVLLPDRDNTFAAFTYLPDGTVQPAAGLTPVLLNKATHTLGLTGLDKEGNEAFDENSKLIALDRVSQRMEAWGIAEAARLDVDAHPNNDAVKRGAVRTAKESGFFSIWMTVFSNNPDMRNRFIDAFEGTRGSGCFDAVTTQPISPSSNPDNLLDGAKI